jgi:hypothetical protein
MWFGIEVARNKPASLATGRACALSVPACHRCRRKLRWTGKHGIGPIRLSRSAPAANAVLQQTVDFLVCHGNVGPLALVRDPWASVRRRRPALRCDQGHRGCLLRWIAGSQRRRLRTWTVELRRRRGRRYHRRRSQRVCDSRCPGPAFTRHSDCADGNTACRQSGCRQDADVSSPDHFRLSRFSVPIPPVLFKGAKQRRATGSSPGMAVWVGTLARPEGRAGGAVRTGITALMRGGPSDANPTRP